MSTTTLLAPRRISTLAYARAALAVRLDVQLRRLTAELPGATSELPGATSEWPELLRAGVPARSLDGRPAPAIAAVAHREVHDPHLGVLRVASLEPARLYDALAGAFPVAVA